MRAVPILVAALMIGCSAPESSQDAKSALFGLVDLQDAAGVIVPPEYGPAEWANGLFYGSHIDGFWPLTPDDVRHAHARVQIDLEDVHSVMRHDLVRGLTGEVPTQDVEFILDHLGEFDSQYLGFVIQGRRRVMCNFFADEGARQDDLWRREWITVDGGGPAYWTIEYDVDEDRCFNFWPNTSM